MPTAAQLAGTLLANLNGFRAAFNEYVGPFNIAVRELSEGARSAPELLPVVAVLRELVDALNTLGAPVRAVLDATEVLNPIPPIKEVFEIEQPMKLNLPADYKGQVNISNAFYQGPGPMKVELVGDATVADQVNVWLHYVDKGTGIDLTLKDLPLVVPGDSVIQIRNK